MNRFNNSLTITGVVKEVFPDRGMFQVQTRSGDHFNVYVSPTTTYSVLRNLDNLDRDRVIDPANVFGSRNFGPILENLKKIIFPNVLISIQGIQYVNGDLNRYEARNIHLLSTRNADDPKFRYLFEETHWWLDQIGRMADSWLDAFFGEKRTYALDDFSALYRTNLNIFGLPTDDKVQECATLSRLIYGLSSAYLLTGSKRYFLAAKAGVDYQRETFRRLTHDGRYCFWSSAKRNRSYTTDLIIGSENADDRETIPLYEQIYALAGLTQFYRITNQWGVLDDIKRTVRMFNDFFLDSKEKNPDFPGKRGYFSHIDPANMRPDSPKLGENKLKKNWNSIGDHIPAYLINLICALDPLPKDLDDDDTRRFVENLKWMLDETSSLIVEKFPGDKSNPPSVYVNERFDADWNPDHTWGWQQNRAIVGHNLKIAWNLSRVANYYDSIGNTSKANDLSALAVKIGVDMEKTGVDTIRGGIWDAVERNPSPGMDVQFAWGNTKDFWQQEQAILAYLILHGREDDQSSNKPFFLQLAREMQAFWNLFFLNREQKGVYFRVTENGLPYMAGGYMIMGGHAVAGYHSFELSFLAHIYTRSWIDLKTRDNSFCLFFKPKADLKQRSINVKPDFFREGDIYVKRINVNGIDRNTVDPDNFQIELCKEELGGDLMVEFASRFVPPVSNNR